MAARRRAPIEASQQTRPGTLAHVCQPNGGATTSHCCRLQSPYGAANEEGVKYGLVDLDPDGDLDVLTSEERQDLGVLRDEN